MSEAWRGGSTRRWRKLRAAILLRDSGRCRLGPLRAERGDRDVCTSVATEAHHLDGRISDAHDDPARIVASCRACNVAEGDPRQRPDSDPPATAINYWA